MTGATGCAQAAGMTLRLGLIASAALASSFALPAQAACTPSSPLVTACTANRPVVTACVHLTSPCTAVVVNGPLCVYGNIGTGYFVTVWC